MLAGKATWGPAEKQQANEGLLSLIVWAINSQGAEQKQDMFSFSTLGAVERPELIVYLRVKGQTWWNC